MADDDKTPPTGEGSGTGQTAKPPTHKEQLQAAAEAQGLPSTGTVDELEDRLEDAVGDKSGRPPLGEIAEQRAADIERDSSELPPHIDEEG